MNREGSPPGRSLCHRPRPLSEYKRFDQQDGLLTPLRPADTQRDKAGNRHLLFAPYAQSLLRHFFNPAGTPLGKVRRVFGIRPTALGSLSEAARVFDPALLGPFAILRFAVPDSRTRFRVAADRSRVG